MTSKITNAIPKSLVPLSVINSSSYTGDGAYGHAIQDMYDDAGIETNHGDGVDIPSIGLEIKSWDRSKNGAVSVGSSSKEDILATSGHCLLKKLQTWNLHQHRNGIISNVQSANFNRIHNELICEVEKLARDLEETKDSNKNKLASSDHFILEKVPGKKNSAKLRILPSKVNSLFQAANTAKKFNEFFGESE